ncbi:hypothetical protein BEN47_09145 [Hymenobacter lapidarius]|uniref:Uncharacterized protein n=1 Tax=Hymenobacter lapidarius TaxID=1908237 RepID=A0A1G1TBJ2_9BACT|nr:hypothetical protein [Hymenobacter lapidarius]OGX88243.1 hypothetical protein BEN47_09145 [Hymenobacter lapidarius]
MIKCLPFVVLLLAGVQVGGSAQSRPGPRKPAPASKAGPAARSTPKADPVVYAPITTRREEAEKKPASTLYMGKVKLKKPVLVYYQEPAPGKAVQQLITSEENLGLLRTLDLEQLMARREVFVNGLGNLALPGSDVTRYRLLGTRSVAEATRRPVGDGRSFFFRLKVPSSGVRCVVRESAEEYRHFVKGPQKWGYLLDFGANGLPGVDSVRAVYTLRRMNAFERSAGAVKTIQ